MKLEKIIGFSIIALSILVFSIQISLSQISRYIDQTTGQYSNAFTEYVPAVTYISTPIAIGVGLYLILIKDK